MYVYERGKGKVSRWACANMPRSRRRRRRAKMIVRRRHGLQIAYCELLVAPFGGHLMFIRLSGSWCLVPSAMQIEALLSRTHAVAQAKEQTLYAFQFQDDEVL